MVELEKTGKLTAGSRADLGRVGIGVAIREGAPAPDFSTPEAFRKMLLDAKSVAYTAPELGGTSGVHLFALLKKLGIYDDDHQEGRSTPRAASTSRRRWRAARPRSASR